METGVKTAMEHLIREARQTIPFGMSFSGNCEGRCDECPEKLMEFLDISLGDWESRLERGIVPDQDDVQVLSGDYRTVYEIFKKKSLI